MNLTLRPLGSKRKAAHVTTTDWVARFASGGLRNCGPSSDFDLNPDVELKPGRTLRPAAVLVPLMQDGGETRVVLTKRSSRLKHHPGQIAFPGGKLDDTDADATAAALREAEEEIGLPHARVSVLTTLPAHETVTGFSVTAVVGTLSAPARFTPEAGEVAEVFTVPLGHLMETENYGIQSRLWRGQRRFYYVVPWGPYYIWGATARILMSMAAGTK